LGSKPPIHTQAVEAVEVVVMPAGQAEHVASSTVDLKVPTAQASHRELEFMK